MKNNKPRKHSTAKKVTAADIFKIVLTKIEIFVLLKISLEPEAYATLVNVPLAEKKAIDNLLEEEMIDTTEVSGEDGCERDDDDYEIYIVTEKGNAYLDALLRVKLPVPTTIWVVPRGGN